MKIYKIQFFATQGFVIREFEGIEKNKIIIVKTGYEWGGDRHINKMEIDTPKTIISFPQVSGSVWSLDYKKGKEILKEYIQRQINQYFEINEKNKKTIQDANKVFEDTKDKTEEIIKGNKDLDLSW